MTTWRKALTIAMRGNRESFADIEGSTLTEAQLDASFDDGWGGTKGVPFTVWTKTRVYFPVCYDGSEWVADIPRNPNGEATSHVGG